MSSERMTGMTTDAPQIAPAYQVWHCGRMGCDNELEPDGNDRMHCPNCGCVFAGDGAFVSDGDDDPEDD